MSFGENRGLRSGIAEGYRQALVRGYDYCGRLESDGQHPAAELVVTIGLTLFAGALLRRRHRGKQRKGLRRAVSRG